MKKNILFLILILFLFLSTLFIFKKSNNNPGVIFNPQARSAISENTTVSYSSNHEEIIQKIPDTKLINLPEKINLDVPFISQAPLANWDNLHNEACEEASVLQVILFLQNSNMNKNDADKKIIEMVNWQEDYWGGHYDLPAEKVKEFVQKYFYKNAEIFYDISIENIKEQLADGSPVIIPASGRTLNNPNFKNPGPVYHMLVIRGYDDNKKQFITNDVGTRKGENYRYSYDVLMNSIHDMPKWKQYKELLDKNPQMIFSGRKAMIIIKN